MQWSFNPRASEHDILYKAFSCAEVKYFCKSHPLVLFFFLMATVMNHHKLKAFNKTDVLSHIAGGQKSENQGVSRASFFWNFQWRVCSRPFHITLHPASVVTSPPLTLALLPPPHTGPVTTRGHLDYPGHSPHLQIFNLIILAKSLSSWKVTES